jgi:type IV pilus assembly protein PilQ
VKAVLLSLSRTAGQNILIKDNVKGEVSVDLNDVPWDQAFKAILRSQGLTYVWEGNILQIMTIEDLELDLQVSSIREKRHAQLMGERQVAPLLTTTIRIDYADTKELMENLKVLLAKDEEGKTRGEVRMDEHTNSLIIQAIRSDIVQMVSLIKEIDKPTHQILINAKIVEASKIAARSLGIQWGGTFRKGNVQLTPGGTTATSGTSGSSGSSGSSGNSGGPLLGNPGLSGEGFGINFPIGEEIIQKAGGLGSFGLLVGSLGGSILDIQLSALEEDGQVRILSSPSITTLDNQMAFTENGERVPYLSSSGSNSSSASQNVQFVDAVLRLEITPHVIGTNYLKMDIKIKKDEVDPVRNVEGNPYITKKQTETTLIVQDGETIVISGLTKQTISKDLLGVPVLKDIPFLGWFFKGETKSDNMEEVLIFITPHILPYRGSPAVQKKPDASVIQNVSDGPIVEAGPIAPVAQDGPDMSAIQEESIKPEVQDVPDESVFQERLDGPIIQEELDTSIVHETPDGLDGGP